MNKISSISISQPGIHISDNKKEISINANNIQGMDISNRETLYKISNFIINIREKNREKGILPNSSDSFLLGKISVQLSQKIKEMASNTTGIFGFLRYLFHPRAQKEKKIQVESMQILQGFITDICNAQPKPSKRHQILQTNVLKELQNKFNKMPKQDQGAQPEKPTQQANKDLITHSDSPHDLQVKIELPVVEITENSQEKAPIIQIIPNIPPPPLPKATPIAKKLFTGEPKKVPDIKLAGQPGAQKVEMLSEVDLEKEIREIDTFVNAMKEALTPIETALREEGNLKEHIEEANQEQNQQISLINNLKAMVEILKQPGDISYLKFKIKTGEERKLPLFSDDKFTEYNEKLTRAGAQPLSDKYRKSTVLNDIEKSLQEEITKNEQTNKNIESLTKQRALILEEKNNQIPFKEYAEVLKTKKKLLETWERALAARRKQLEKLSMPLKNTSSATETLFKRARSSIQDIINQNDNLTKLEDLQALIQIENNQSAQIKLKGDMYYKDLFI
jgi:hypothetical protein